MKISVCTIVKNDTFYLEMMIKSVKDYVDEIVVVDNDETNKELCENYDNVKYITHTFDDNLGEGRQMAKDNATGDWILWLDADEVMHEEELPQLYKMIEEIEKEGIDCVNLQYHHFIENFSKIDNSEPIHIGLVRFHKNYPEVILNHTPNHTLPKYAWKKRVFIPLSIWHLGYLRGMDKILERYNRNMTFSEMHSSIYLIHWKDWHYKGTYPTKPINVDKIPQVIKDTFRVEE